MHCHTYEDAFYITYIFLSVSHLWSVHGLLGLELVHYCVEAREVTVVDCTEVQ